MAAAGGDAGRRAGRAGEMFRALSHRNFRLFWAGAFLSNSGTWMQTVAQSWLVLQLTNSAFWLGVDTFAATVPGLLLTLPAGVFADQLDRKRLLLLAQVGAGASALTLAALVRAGIVGEAADVWMILLLSFVTGCCFSVAGPSYQAITVDLVERHDLANAIALSSVQFHFSRVVGPLLAGLAMGLVGVAGCFLLNGLSFVAIIVALSLVRMPARPGAPGVPAETGAPKGVRSLLRDLAGGFRYMRGHQMVRLLLVCSTAVSLFGAPYLVLVPLFAKNIYGWGEAGLSLLMGTAGAGALAGSLMLAYLGDFRRKGWFALASSFAGGASIVGFGTASSPALAVPLLFCVGFTMVSFFAVSNTLLQQLVSDEMRGRVMSMWILTFIGTMPVGSFLAGAAAERFGPQPTLAACGLVVALFAVVTGALNPRLRGL